MIEEPTKEAYAFLGDAVYSRYARKAVLKKGLSKSGQLHEAVLQYVTAQKQAEAYLKIQNFLNETEQNLFRRAHNSTHLNCPKSASIQEYRVATGLEALFGYLDYSGQYDRLNELASIIFEDAN